MTNPTPFTGAARNPRELTLRAYSLDDRRCALVLAGEVDLASAPDLKAALGQLLELGYSDLVLDLADVSHLDSTGIGVLVGLQKRLEDGGRLALAAVPPNVALILTAVGLDAWLQSFPSVEAAFAESGGAEHRSPVPLEPRRPAPHPPGTATEPASAAARDAAAVLDADAGLVLGLASTALPFAESSLEEAERWLRILCRYGDAGRILREAGVGEAPVAGLAANAAASSPDPAMLSAESRLAAVGEQAKRAAADRHAGAVGTVDVLTAVVSIYGADFARVLAAHGGDRATVDERLGIR